MLPPTPPDTRDRILDAAERLFAERGFAATSLRALTQEAGVHLAAANYHFGSKRELLRTVIERRVGGVNEERLKGLALLRSRADGKPLDLEAVLDVLLRPLLADPTATGIRSISAMLFREPIETIGPVMLEVFSDATDRFTEALGESLPHLSEYELTERLQFLIGTMVHVASGHLDFFLQARELPARPPEQLVEALVVFLAAALCAPASPAAPGDRP
jgi:AcrR family transcriptional regulator